MKISNTRIQKAKDQHEKWLLKNNCHPTQIKSRKKVKYKVNNNTKTTYYDNLSNTIAPPVLKNDIWEKIRTGEESLETIEEIKHKAANCLPLYNKGGMQFTSSKQELRNAGKKTAI